MMPNKRVFSIIFICFLLGFMIAVQLKTTQDNLKSSTQYQRIEQLSDILLRTERERDALKLEIARLKEEALDPGVDVAEEVELQHVFLLRLRRKNHLDRVTFFPHPGALRRPPGDRGRVVAQLFHRFEHPLRRLWIQLGTAVQCPRNRRDRKSRLSRYVTDRHCLFCRHDFTSLIFSILILPQRILNVNSR